MSLFLIANNNLKDLTDISKARDHLGIGTLAIQNSNNVNIEGGLMKLSNIILNNGNASYGKVLVAIDDYGTMDWKEPFIHEWSNEPQNNINLSEFINDTGYVRRDALCNVAFTGDYEDLTGKPSNLNDFYENSIYMRIQNNLSELLNPEEARNNLGLGPLAIQDTYFVSVSNLFVTSEFRFYPDPKLSSLEGKFLALGEGNKTEWVDLPIATEDTYGIVQLQDSFLSTSKQHAPTAYALRNAYYDLYYRVADVNEQIFMNTLIDYFGLLTKTNNLSELYPNRENVRTNLGIGTLATQDLTAVSVSNITIENNLIFANAPIIGGILKCDTNGLVYWSEFPIATAPEYASQVTNEGLIKISHSYSGNIEDVVPSSYAVSNMYVAISNQIENVRDEAPKYLSQLLGIDNYLLVEDNLKNVNAITARKNLGLHAIAHTGDYNALENKPTNLSEFTNDKFLERTLNLSDLTNPTLARANLGLGNMSVQNKNSVEILGGSAKFNNLTITERFTYENNGSVDLTGTFLKSRNYLGEIECASLPKATEEIYGVVQLTNDIDEVNSEKVASATLVYKTYHILLERIQSLEESLARHQYIQTYNVRQD
jgi:hypothetical protein